MKFMNQADFKKLLDEALEPIKDKQESHSSALSSIKDKQESHSAALVSIESKLDAYGDMYKINNSNAKKLEKRVETLEENAGITPPAEFTLTEVQ